MLTSAALALVLGTATPALTAAASHSLRPAPCGAVRGPWQLAARTALLPHCTRLSAGNVLLASDPAAALELGKQLLDSPLAPYAWVLVARAHLAQGAPEQAAQAFERAELLDPLALASPLVRHDRAISSAVLGKSDAAAAQYRSLVAQWQLLPRERQVPLLLEAALAVMRQGPDYVHEANGYLDLVSRVDDYRGGRAYFDAIAALARVRVGLDAAWQQTDVEALRALLERGDRSRTAPRFPTAEVAALLAAACEPGTSEARHHWQRFAQTELSRPWREWLARQGLAGRE